MNSIYNLQLELAITQKRINKAKKKQAWFVVNDLERHKKKVLKHIHELENMERNYIEWTDNS